MKPLHTHERTPAYSGHRARRSATERTMIEPLLNVSS